MDEVTSPAESEIQIEKIDLSEPENSGSVSVDANTVTVHPEEGAVATVNDNDAVEANNNPGYITTRVPPFTPQYVDDHAGESTGMKYGEDIFLQETLDYIKSTYGQHYANPEKQGIQVFDLWDSMDILEATCIATAIKYIARYGRKAGYNKKDLQKAIHYITILGYATQSENELRTQ